MLEKSPRAYFDWQQHFELHCLNDRSGIDRIKAQVELQYALTEAIKYVSTQGITRAIWSNESIFDTSSLVIPVLTKLIELGINIHIIVYIRRHDAWLRSAYLQWGIKHKSYLGKIKSFSEWSKENFSNYAAKLDPWLKQQKWATIAVKNFDVTGDVVKDFFEYCDLYDPSIHIVRSNETPNNVCLAIWAMYNAQFDRVVLHSDMGLLLENADLLNKNLRECDLNNLLPSSKDIEELVLVAEQDRNAVNTIFSRFSQPAMKTTELKIAQEVVTQNKINTC